MSKSVLVTGGCGFIGKALCSVLLRQGYEVVIVDIDTSSVGEVINEARIIHGDVTDAGMWKSLPDCDYVFHLAAPSSIILFEDNLDLCIKTTMVGLMNAFEWARSVNANKLIYPSSGSIFGKSSTKCSETTKPDPVNTYGKTKLACEYLAAIYNNYVPSSGLRIFAGYGPEEDRKGKIASVVTLFINDILHGRSPMIYGDGNQTRDFVYIEDIVEAMIKVMTNQATGVLNVGSGESISFNEVVQKINALAGTHVSPMYTKKPSKYLEKTSCDPSTLKRLLGKEVISFDEGIRKYMQHLGHK